MKKLGLFLLTCLISLVTYSQVFYEVGTTINNTNPNISGNYSFLPNPSGDYNTQVNGTSNVFSDDWNFTLTTQISSWVEIKENINYNKTIHISYSNNNENDVESYTFIGEKEINNVPLNSNIKILIETVNDDNAPNIVLSPIFEISTDNIIFNQIDLSKSSNGAYDLHSGYFNSNNSSNLYLKLTFSGNTTGHHYDWSGNMILNSISMEKVSDVGIKSETRKLIYPTMVSDYIHLISDIKSIEIFDLSGRIVYRNMSINSDKLNISHLKRGSYIIFVNRERSIKVVKK